MDQKEVNKKVADEIAKVFLNAKKPIDIEKAGKLLAKALDDAFKDIQLSDPVEILKQLAFFQLRREGITDFEIVDAKFDKDGIGVVHITRPVKFVTVSFTISTDDKDDAGKGP